MTNTFTAFLLLTFGFSVGWLISSRKIGLMAIFDAIEKGLEKVRKIYSSEQKED